MNQCKDCAYRVKAVKSDAVWADCRRYPPQVFADGNGESDNTWPRTHEEDGCGEWAEKDK